MESKSDTVPVKTKNGKVQLFVGRQFIKDNFIWHILELQPFGVLCIIEECMQGCLLDYTYVAQLIEDTDVYMDYGHNWFGT